MLAAMQALRVVWKKAWRRLWEATKVEVTGSMSRQRSDDSDLKWEQEYTAKALNKKLEPDAENKRKPVKRFEEGVMGSEQ